MLTTPYVQSSQVEYYMLSETLCDETLSMEKRAVVNENTVDSPFGKIHTLTFNIPMTQFNRRNWNGRIYGRDIFMKALNGNPLIQHDMKHHSWCGEMGHPSLPGGGKGPGDMSRQMTIDPKLISHTIDKYWEEGDILMSQWTTVAGDYGDTLMKRVLTGLPAMGSTRSVGGVDKSGNVIPGFILITEDSVIRPSSQEAYHIAGSEHTNNFSLDRYTPKGQSMTNESAIVDVYSDSFRDYILSESTSKKQIDMLCDTLHISYDAMTINEGAVHLTSYDKDTKNTVVVPLTKLIGENYSALF